MSREEFESDAQGQQREGEISAPPAAQDLPREQRAVAYISGGKVRWIGTPTAQQLDTVNDAMRAIAGEKAPIPARRMGDDAPATNHPIPTRRMGESYRDMEASRAALRRNDFTQSAAGFTRVGTLGRPPETERDWGYRGPLRVYAYQATGATGEPYRYLHCDVGIVTAGIQAQWRWDPAQNVRIDVQSVSVSQGGAGAALAVGTYKLIMRIEVDPINGAFVADGAALSGVPGACAAPSATEYTPRLMISATYFGTQGTANADMILAEFDVANNETTGELEVSYVSQEQFGHLTVPVQKVVPSGSGPEGIVPGDATGSCSTRLYYCSWQSIRSIGLTELVPGSAGGTPITER